MVRMRIGTHRHQYKVKPGAAGPLNTTHCTLTERKYNTVVIL